MAKKIQTFKNNRTRARRESDSQIFLTITVFAFGLLVALLAFAFSRRGGYMWLVDILFVAALLCGFIGLVSLFCWFRLQGRLDSETPPEDKNIGLINRQIRDGLKQIRDKGNKDTE